jgi:TAG lipase / steryl ester hydrolase / phospholipase A2 / LPA acyltransferase
MNHIGVLATLMESNLLPRIISGTSAGSIVAAVCCTRTDEELPQLLRDFVHGDFNVFQDSLNPESIYDHVARLLKVGMFPTAIIIDDLGVWSDISYLIKVMRSRVGDLTFQEAYVKFHLFIVG